MEDDGSYKWDLEGLFLRPNGELVYNSWRLARAEILQVHNQLQEAGDEVMVEIILCKNLCNGHNIILCPSDRLQDN
jgi:hypothetical protein